ncbi:MAG: hypothetical protein WC250_03430 [Candidatus Paceibacterota bacterium]
MEIIVPLVIVVLLFVAPEIVGVMITLGVSVVALMCWVLVLPFAGVYRLWLYCRRWYSSIRGTKVICQKVK